MLDWHIPYLTSDIPGIGGVIRVEPEDFVVEEIPAYEPCGEGEHTYFRVEKRDISTMLLIKAIAKALRCSRRDVGCAGLKDARAVARQTFSVHNVPTEQIMALQLENARVLWAKRHTNKLRTGHLRGNQFTIRIRNTVASAASRVPAILEILRARGVPNGYGVQRFGRRGDNHEIGMLLLHGGREAFADRGMRYPNFRMRQFFVSALQSALFNYYLTARMQAGTMDDLLLGDVAKKQDTGGIFTVEDVAVERPRVKAWEISPTGPMYGYKLLQAKADAGALEAQVLAEAGLSLEDFRPVKAKGLRRPLRYQPGDLSWQIEPGGEVMVSFFAPKGSYATMLLRELMKVDVDLEQNLDG